MSRNKADKNSRSRLTLITAVLLVVILVLVDQITKYLAVVHLKGQDPVVLIKGVLELYYLENRGAAFSIFQNQQWFFYILTTAFLIAAVWFLHKVPKTKLYDPMVICILVLCAGAIGNLIDRIVNRYVVDFIYFVIIDFPVFNVADIYVTLGVIFLICFVLFYYKDDDLKAISGRQKADSDLPEKKK